MKKALIIAAATAGLGLVAGPAFAAPGAQTGEGKDKMCWEDGNSNGVVDDGEEYPCPDPVDPTADSEPRSEPADVDIVLDGDPNDRWIDVAVAVGDEGEAGSVGRAGVSGSEDQRGAQVYLEDYTDGDQAANAVEEVDEATGCALLPSTTPCGEDSPNDAALITVGLP